MKSIYESARVIMERLGATGAAEVNKNKPNLNLMDKFRTSVGIPVGGTKPQVAVADPVVKPQTQVQAAVKPSVKKVAANKPAQATMAAAPSQDKLNTTQRSAEKSGPDTDAMKKGIAASSPALSSVDTTNKQAAADKPVEAPTSSGSGSSSYTSSAGKADNDPVEKPTNSSSYTSSAGNADNNPVEKPQAAVVSTPSSSERSAVKDGSGNTVKSGSGGNVTTRSADEIERDNKKGRGRGMSMESVNKKFDITDALYQSVMEVMKKDKKEGSVPRNSEEEKLAAFHGDPKRITHGDVLKARGVTKEETEEVDEALVGNQHKIDANKNNKIDAHDFKLLRAKKKTDKEEVEEGMMSAAKSVAKKILSKLGGGSDEDQRKDLQRKMGVPQTGKKSMKENKDTPGNSYEHQCAIHVKSESYGEGRTITTQHADPDTEGNIAWYDVMFEHGIEKQVPTSTLEVLVSEMHGHSKKKKM